MCILKYPFKLKTFKSHEYQHDLKKKKKKMKGEVNFSFRGSSLNDINLYLKQKKAWIHRRKVLNCLCSLSYIVPFNMISHAKVHLF